MKMEDIAETSAPHRTIPAPPARSEDGRLMYFEHQLQPVTDYKGFLDDVTIPEARAAFEELLDRFHIHDWRGFPLPPAGLPGFLHSGYKEDDLAGKMLSLGIQYALAVIRNERRTMHLRWRDAEDLVRTIQAAEEDRIYLAQAEQNTREWEAKEAIPQFVYFIGTQSGPIKIGIATKPRNRLKELQTSHHDKLEILATCDGDMELEKAYHKRFADRRLKGEWFERCPEIEAEIERLSA